MLPHRLTGSSNDKDLVQAASDTLQCHEKLCHLMSDRLKDVPQAMQGIPYPPTHPHTHTHTYSLVLAALEEGRLLLDQLRLLKSRLEGSHYKFQPPTFSNDLLTELRLLCTAFTPSTLNHVTKAKMQDKLDQLFSGKVKRVVCAYLLTCPWFAAAQAEVSAQARNNILYVVYTASDEQFFSLASPHEKELGETVDEVLT